MRNTIAKDLRTSKYAKKVVASKKHYTRKLKHKGNQIMKNYVKILAVSTVALSLGACNVATIAPLAGTALGGAGGGALGNQFGKGTGKTISTIAGTLLGGLGGYKAGQFVAMPYQNRSAINGNTMNIHRNGQRIDQNGQRIDQNGYRIDMNGQRIDDMHITNGQQRYNYDGTPVIINGGSIPPQTQNQPSAPTMSNYGCKIQRNYVVCNSN